MQAKVDPSQAPFSIYHPDNSQSFFFNYSPRLTNAEREVSPACVCHLAAACLLVKRCFHDHLSTCIPPLYHNLVRRNATKPCSHSLDEPQITGTTFHTSRLLYDMRLGGRHMKTGRSSTRRLRGETEFSIIIASDPRICWQHYLGFWSRFIFPLSGPFHQLACFFWPWGKILHFFCLYHGYRFSFASLMFQLQKEVLLSALSSFPDSFASLSFSQSEWMIKLLHEDIDMEKGVKWD